MDLNGEVGLTQDPDDNPLNASQKYEDIKFTCDICGNHFSRKGNLDMHRKSVHQVQKFHCGQCGYSATQKVGLDKHIQSMHGGKLCLQLMSQFVQMGSRLNQTQAIKT